MYEWSDFDFGRFAGLPDCVCFIFGMFEGLIEMVNRGR